MIKQPTIKHKNRKHLITYLFLNIIIFALFGGIIELSTDNIKTLLSKLQDPENIFALFIVPASIILEGVVSSDVKAILVFWKLNDPLPGSRAFSKIARDDPRIDNNKLAQLFNGNLPESHREQNQAWYNIFKKYENDSVVYESHKVFLLARDIATLTIVLIPVNILSHIVVGTHLRVMSYHISTLISMFIICCIATQNYGNRLVANVLVRAIKE